MIKRETKYIIRRILIGVGIALILGYINACEVKAETTTNGLNYTQLRYYTDSTLITSLSVNTTNNNVYIFNGSGQFSNNWQLRSTTAYTIENNQIVLFNIRIRYTPNTAVTYPNINSINFGGQSCFYMVTNNEEVSSSLNDTYFSVICLMNSSVAITNGTTLISFSSDPVIYSSVAISGITYVNNLNAYNLIQTELATANTRLLDLNYRGQYIYEILLREETSLATLITNTNNIFTRLTWINTLLENIQLQNTGINNSINSNTQAVNDMNDTIKSDSVDSPNNSISQMEQNLPTNSVISDLLTLPIRMFQNIVNAIDGTCSPFSLGALFGTNLILPCINIQNYLGSALWGAIDVIFCGIFVLSMRKKFVQIFENITSLKNGGNELE